MKSKLDEETPNKIYNKRKFIIDKNSRWQILRNVFNKLFFPTLLLLQLSQVEYKPGYDYIYFLYLIYLTSITYFMIKFFQNFEKKYILKLIYSNIFLTVIFCLLPSFYIMLRNIEGTPDKLDEMNMIYMGSSLLMLLSLSITGCIVSFTKRHDITKNNRYFKNTLFLFFIIFLTSILFNTSLFVLFN